MVGKKNFVEKHARLLGEFAIYLLPLVLTIHVAYVGRYPFRLMLTDIFFYWVLLFCASFEFYLLLGRDIIKTGLATGFSALLMLLFNRWFGYDLFGSFLVVFTWFFVIGVLPAFFSKSAHNPELLYESITKAMEMFKIKTSMQHIKPKE